MINKTSLLLSLITSALVLTSVSLLMAGCEESGGISSGLKRQIDNVVECEMLEKQVPGISISVIRDGDVIYRQGYGKADLGEGIDVTPETIFALGSVTKIFTAIGVLNLHDRGLIDIDDKIGLYLPDLPNEEWKERTVRDLLSMSSGIAELAFCESGPKQGEACEDHPQGSPYTFNLCGEGHKCVSANRVPYPEYLERAAVIPLQFDGGAKYFYSNTNFVILGELIAEVSGLSYEDYINRIILDPLGMDVTRPNNVPPPPIEGLAKPYKHNPAGEGGFDCVTFADPPENCKNPAPTDVKCSEIPTEDLRLPEQSFAAGWLVTNQIDMTRLERALHELSSQLLTKETYDIMWTNRQLNNGNFERFGLGWLVCSEKNDMFCPKPVDPESGGELEGPLLDEPADKDGKVVAKDGGLPGYSAQVLRYLDDGISVIVLSNLKDGNFKPAGLAAEIAKLVRESEE